MNGIILINKDAGLTSRDVVNKVSKRLNIKKVGHAGTLDPLATGLLVIGIGNGTKILDLLTLDKKEYISTVKIGIQTDTYDITGKVIKKIDNIKITKEDILKAFKKFNGEYNQEVPKYSAVKINGKKLYEYARNNLDIELPKRKVNIYNIELLDYDLDNLEFTFKTLVSKGTYIRSLINDIGDYLNIPLTMKELKRIRSGKFLLSDSNNINDEYKIISIKDCLDYKIVKIVDKNLLKKIKNGNKINLNLEDEFITLIDDKNNNLAIYKKDKLNEYKAYKVFN